MKESSEEDVRNLDIPEKFILDQVMDAYRSTRALRSKVVHAVLYKTEMPSSITDILREEETSEFVSSVTLSPTDGKIEIVFGGEAHESISGKSLFVIPKPTKKYTRHPATWLKPEVWLSLECVPGPGLPSNIICSNCSIPRPLRTKPELPIPPVLLSEIQNRSWPRSIRNRELRQLSQYITDEEFELFVTSNQIRGENQIASLDLFYDLVEDEQEAKRWRLALGSTENGKVDLDWLDLEQALVIGGGADYGDDAWLVLDYRTDSQDPRVIYNWYQHQDGVKRDEEDPEQYQVTWRELSPSISELAKVISKSCKPWWKFW